MNTSTTNPGIKFYYLSEDAITIKFGEGIHDEVFERIVSFSQILNNRPFPGLITTVQAYVTLTIYYDPILISKSKMYGSNGYDKVVNYLTGLCSDLANNLTKQSTHFKIPVCYDKEFGLDIEELAENKNLSLSELIKLHTSQTYKVYMIGFIPGFAYMGGMDERLSSPRKEVPRKAVPSGSVGIAGYQTGIYPLTSPGGWQIIGRTPLSLFSLTRKNPTLLEAGDLVSFECIDRQTFQELLDARDADQTY
ncbi:MAG: 5-oxoprolinase subunit PxpB [Pedobacter sp.]|nr:MAG: 5-oxoprolinase subunit PxpB [Pedobacter sp.]